jgi:dipeptidyl aminopeptidase/acylaminoacyl peptidase
MNLALHESDSDLKSEWYFRIADVVTHCPDWFQAAAAGEGGLYNPEGYWLTDDSARASMRRFLGGGPYGRSLDHRKEVSPVLSADRLRIPLLMEYSDAILSGLKMHQAIAEQGGQAELVLHPDEAHVFLQPRNRFNSMARHYLQLERIAWKHANFPQTLWS